MSDPFRLIAPPAAPIVILRQPVAARLTVIGGASGGGGGGAAADFEFTQATPAAEWIVNHNLGLEPIVRVLSVGGVELVAEVVHASVNQVRIYFASAQAGRVRCV